MSKHILVTGASSGIGEAVTRVLASLGYQLVLVARNREKLEKIAEGLNGAAKIFPYDLCNLENIESIFSFCKENGIKLEGMVHSAGIAGATPIRSNEIDLMERIMRVNYFSFVELGKYFSQRKYSHDGSSIVVLSSMAAKACYKGTNNYAASKQAVNVAVTVMAKEFEKRRIRVNSVMPANVATPLLDTAELDIDFQSQQSYGLIDVEQVAYLVEFLLSEKSKYITGAHIPISAGML